MWRCASRRIIGVLGVLSASQHPALAEPTVLPSVVGSSLAPNGSKLQSSSTTAAASTTIEQPAPEQEPRAAERPKPDNHRHKTSWPTKLEQGTHFAVLNGSDGSRSTLSSICSAIATADVVFLGEYHDDPVAHALQLELLKRAARQLGYHLAQPARLSSNRTSRDRAEGDHHHQQQDGASIRQQADTPAPPQQHKQQHLSRPLVLSLEMFERDIQVVLNEYLAGNVQPGGSRQ